MYVTLLSSLFFLSDFPSGIPPYANFFHLVGLWFITPHVNLDCSTYTILWAVVNAKHGTVLWAGTREGAVVGGSRGLKGNFFEASLYSSDAQLLSFRGLRIIRYGGTYIYVKTFLWLYSVYYFRNLFYEHSVPRHKIVDPALIMVTCRVVLTAVVLKPSKSFINWTG
jgi:hypothetical protein